MEREELLNAHQNKLHHLAQYLSAFGGSYLPEKEDHSHTNLGWDIEKSSLVSREYKGIHLELEYPGLMLYMIRDGHRHALDPLGAPLRDVGSWIRETLTSLGADPAPYSLDMGFTLNTEEDVFISLDNNDEKILLQLTEERNIAQRALEQFRETTELTCSEIRVWPHHFDTGMLMYTEEKGTIYGLGYAPADENSGVPYFYAYLQSDNPADYSGLPDITPASWHINQWKGAIIPVDRALDLQVITRFYKKFVTVMSSRI